MKLKILFSIFLLVGLVLAVATPYGEPDQVYIHKGQTHQVDVDEGYHQAFYIENEKVGYPQITVEISDFMVADAYYGEIGVYEENVMYLSDRDPDNRCGESFTFTYYHDGDIDSRSYFQITGWHTEFGGNPLELYECIPGEEMGYGYFDYRITVTYNDFYECLDNSDCGSDHYCDLDYHKCYKIEEDDDDDPPPDDPGDECTTSVDCNSGEQCVSGECVPVSNVECVVDSDCGEGKKCYDGVCGPVEDDGCCGPAILLGLLIPLAIVVKKSE